MSSTLIRIYEGEALASKYKKYREAYPPSIKTAVLEYMQSQSPMRECQDKFEKMLDVGCGSGQATHMFAPHFDSVLGIDVSSAQIDKANESNVSENVTFQLVHDNIFPVKDGTIDFINCAAVAHWLDMKTFQDECDRVLKPGGCVAIYAYCSGSIKIDGIVDSQLTVTFVDISKKFIKDCKAHPRNLLWLDKYQTIYDQITNSTKRWKEIPRFDVEYTVTSFKNLMSTIGEYEAYMKTKPENDPREEAVASLKKLLGVEDIKDDDVRFVVEMDIPMIVFSKK